MKTATKVKDVTGMRGDVILCQMDPPLEGHTYVIVSAVSLGVDAQAMDSVLGILAGYEQADCETYIFAADEDGEVIDWSELDGSIKGVK
ncbi:hypothetical protein, partial [Campylobacter ureolyticus]|uniref:hypothetical protein n=1 Tax=Campylobacter ureolyticus TaxID=827 RepID=UPI0022B38C46